MSTEYDDDEYVGGAGGGDLCDGHKKRSNNLPFWGSQQTMNLNPLILTNIQNSPYFKVKLFSLKTYHEVIDEIYYNVTHLEPWERGSRKTAGQTGMCGGVRGVGAGGIVSSAFCVLYKLCTMKLTRKQVNGLINHCDSPYIRGLGFMYIRFTQPPTDYWDWFEPYLQDDEEIDVKAGGGMVMTIGDMVKAFLAKLEWFDTRFPRIPVNVQKQITDLLDAYRAEKQNQGRPQAAKVKGACASSRAASPESHRQHYLAPAPAPATDDPDKCRRRSRSRSRDRSHSHRRHRSPSPRRGREQHSGSRERHHHHHSNSNQRDYADELRSYTDQQQRHKRKKHKRSRSRSRSRHR